MPPENAIVALRDRYSGGNLLREVESHFLAGDPTTSLQFYFDRTSRGDTTYSIGRNTFDIDFQHHLVWGARQDIVWGLGYRLSTDDIDPTLRISATPQKRRTQLFNSFAQDEIAIFPDRLHLTLGARVEHNDYTGFDFQPSARLVWTPDSKNLSGPPSPAPTALPARSDTDFRVNFEALPGPGNVPILSACSEIRISRNEQTDRIRDGISDNVDQPVLVGFDRLLQPLSRSDLGATWEPRASRTIPPRLTCSSPIPSATVFTEKLTALKSSQTGRWRGSGL